MAWGGGFATKVKKRKNKVSLKSTPVASTSSATEQHPVVELVETTVRSHPVVEPVETTASPQDIIMQNILKIL